MTTREKFCKWALLWLLVYSILRPFRDIIDFGLLNTTYVYDALYFFMMIATVIQGIIGIVAWVKIHRDNERGRTLLIGTYGFTCGIYGLYFLFLTVLLLVPDSIFYPFEYFSILNLFGFSAAVLLLQHFWTKDYF
jgi:hypothetical protein